MSPSPRDKNALEKKVSLVIPGTEAGTNATDVDGTTGEASAASTSESVRRGWKKVGWERKGF